MSTDAVTASSGKKEAPVAEASGAKTVEGAFDARDAAASSAAGMAKAVATLRARLALAGGHVLEIVDHEGAPPTYRVHRWGLTRDLPDLAAVEAFAARVGAA
jgi:hypothetical protein